jgi:hypothetical protein
LPDELKKVINASYKTANYQVDLYVAFFELSINLSKAVSTIALITPNSWLKNLSMASLRMYLLENTSLLSVIPDVSNAFDASVDTSISIFSKGKNEGAVADVRRLKRGAFEFSHKVNLSEFGRNEGAIFDVESCPEIRDVLNKVRSKSFKVSDVFDVTRGYNPYDAATGQSQETISSRAYHSDHKKDETFVPELKGKHVQPYGYLWDGKHFISYGPWLAAPREPKYFTGERIVFREILGRRLVATLIEEDFKIDRSLYIAKPNEGSPVSSRFVLGILTSALLVFYFRYSSNEFDALFPKIRVAEFKELPIPAATLAQQSEIEKRVEKILAQKKKTPDADVSALEAEIDQLVYKLYSLTDEEVKIVEGAGK